MNTLELIKIIKEQRICKSCEGSGKYHMRIGNNVTKVEYMVCPICMGSKLKKK